jgi:putative transposase
MNIVILIFIDFFKSGSIRKNILGEVKGFYNGTNFDFKTITKECRLQKNTKDDKYILYVPEDVEIEKHENRDSFISLDPGIRTFLTGITNKNIIEIGRDIGEKIKKYEKRKDKINGNEKINEKIKIKNERLCNKKIKNNVDELHWKTINYLTKNYENIFIGDMSTKEIVNKRNNLNKMTKRIALRMRMFEFHERLKYKCGQRDTKHKKVNEYYTSKMCSNCGNIKEDLRGNKKYECEKCKIKIGRDINGCRGILLKGLIKE